MDLVARVVDLLPDFFYVHDYDLRYQYANQRAAEYFGFADKAELVGRTLREVDPNKDQAESIIALCRAIMDAGVPRLTDNIPYQRRDGTPGFLRQHDIPFINPKTGEKMLVGLSRDVTIEHDLADQRLKAAGLQRELEIARRIQAMLWPTEGEAGTGGLDLAGHCRPAAFAGGDFYDWCPASAGAGGSARTLVCLGDVTGHGVGAAILAASCRAYARVLAAVTPLPRALAALNGLLASDITGGDFVTFAAAAIEPSTGRTELVSAGHGPLLVRRASGAIEELESQCPPLGVLEELEPVRPHEFMLEPGDRLVLVSDGLFERKNAAGEQFGTRRLREGMATRFTSSREAIRGLIDSSDAFAGGVAAHDDVTVLAAGLSAGGLAST